MMTKRVITAFNRILVIVVFGLLSLGGQSCGKPSLEPWSGYWWPFDVTKGSHLYDTKGPLEKYDKYAKARTGESPGAKEWEKTYHDSTTPAWYGHCHAWACASILEPEPVKPVRKLGVKFEVGDLKGLLAICHYEDPVDLFVGTRYVQTGIPQDDVLLAVDFHNTLKEWLGIEKIEGSLQQENFKVIGAKKEPIIMDKTSRPEVWNYPIHNYTMECAREPDNPDKIHVVCTVFYLDNNVPMDYVGQKILQSKYTYFILGDFNSPSGGDWEKSSINNHPGFLWHPWYQKEGNPKVKYHMVKEIVYNAIRR